MPTTAASLPEHLTVDMIVRYCSEADQLRAKATHRLITRPLYLGQLICLRAKYGFRIDDVDLTVH